MHKEHGFAQPDARHGPEGPSEASAKMNDLLAKLEELHSSPGVVWRVLQLLNDPKFEIHDVETLLEAEPGLSASILRLVNSSAFGLSQRVTSLRQAITLLGARSLRLAVLSFSLVARLTRGAPAEVYDDFWRRALTAAVAASRLSRVTRLANPDEAYCAGLLAEIGVLALCQVDTKQYVPLYLRHRHTEGLTAAEELRYGFDHANFGKALLERWGLPEPLPRAAGNHHCDVAERAGPVEHAVYGGTLLGEVLWVPQSGVLPRARQWLAEHYGMDTDRFIAFAMECKQEILDSAQLFCVKLKGRIDIGTLRREAIRGFKEVAMNTALEYDSISAVLDQRYTI